ncbi:hypothetical protein [Xanthomonas fragariae]|uniref:hypothetical protein n=1 Tax=Xanthomonas fragariae TaxID=48664 RepID=UPI001EDCE3F1|nr:hypothetical protein [Xanthomonas fragariae]
MADFAWASSSAPWETTLRLLLLQPEGSIDLANAKVAIDRMIDPSIDSDATLREVDQWAAKARARFPVGASKQGKNGPAHFDALRARPVE